MLVLLLLFFFSIIIDFFRSCISIYTLVFVVSYPMASNGIVRACPLKGKQGRKGVRLDRLCFASWNVGTLTSKSIELVKALHKRKVNIACIQETSGWEAKRVKSMGLRPCFFGWLKQFNYSHLPSTNFNPSYQQENFTATILNPLQPTSTNFTHLPPLIYH